jgi:hypothetical protein
MCYFKIKLKYFERKPIKVLVIRGLRNVFSLVKLNSTDCMQYNPHSFLTILNLGFYQ